jgi:hypothetical protein
MMGNYHTYLMQDLHKGYGHGKSLSLPSLIVFVKMLVKKKKLPPYLMLLKVHSEDYYHVKNEMFYVSRSGKMCWKMLCKVWHMKD